MLDSFLTQIAQTSWVEWVGMITGIVGIWLSIKEKLSAWPLFILCYASYVYISYLFGLRAFMGMNAVFILISIYGWYKWSRPTQEGQPELPVSTTSQQHWPLVIAFLIIGTLGIGKLLGTDNEALHPHLDAFATCCGFVAQWMLSRKHIETWFFWIVSDIVYTGLFAEGGLWPSVLLFTVFIILAAKGWYDWKQQQSQLRQQQSLA
jgi:nicotinamide mononucleotide transporter